MVNKEKLNIYTVTIIRVMHDEACEHETVPFLNKDMAIKFYNSSLENWLKKREKFEMDYYDSNFNIEDWYIENLYLELNNDNYKLIHLVFNEGEEKIFELKSNEVTV